MTTTHEVSAPDPTHVPTSSEEATTWVNPDVVGPPSEEATTWVNPDVVGPPSEEATKWVPPTWEEVVEQHSARVYRLAYRLTGNVHDAEDLTHDVFLRVFRSLSSYQPGTFEGWLHRITTNVFLDKMRRKQRIRFDALSDEAAGRLASREPGPEQTVYDGMFDDDIQRALDSLQPDFRAAVVLCDIEGLTYEEVAATLGVKLGTVRSRIHRGRAHLRESLAHRAPVRPVVEAPVVAGRRPVAPALQASR